MADVRPFLGFAFAVEITPEGASAPLVGGSFAECDGLEISHDVKSIRDGGDQMRVVRSGGPVSYANLSLKRGMTSDLGLWDWFTGALADPFARADAEVVLMDGQGGERLRFLLSRCLPVRLKAPALVATASGVAIEELQIAYEQLRVKPGRAA
jgi:phage tail-like protein